MGYYIVAKYTPMAPDGECGESVHVISEKAVESKLLFFLCILVFSLNILMVNANLS